MHLRSILLLFVFLLSGCFSSDGPLTFTSRTPLPKLTAPTAAQDWRNNPDSAKLHNFDYAFISARAQLNGGPVGGNPHAENLIAAGVKVMFVVFPCFFWWNGNPLPEGDLDREINDLAVQYDAILKKPDGTWATTDSLGGCFVLDFRNLSFVQALSQLIVDFTSIGHGILEHGACESMGWDPQLSDLLTASGWDNWSTGFRYYFSELRRHRPDWEISGVCDWGMTWMPDTYDGVFLELIGSSLHPVGVQTYNNLIRAGDRNVVALDYAPTFDSRRRAAAVMAILWDALFLYGAGGTGGDVMEDPEHFQIKYGSFPNPPQELAPGIWARVGTHGFVVGNFTGKLNPPAATPYDYTNPIDGRTCTINADDALAVQFKDTDTNLDLTTWITNGGCTPPL